MLKHWLLLFFTIISVIFISSCHRKEHYEGYIEGDLTYISSPVAGKLLVMPVDRGTQVKKGQLLFKLEQQPELSSLQQASYTMNQLQDTLIDLTKGKRPSELASIEAQIKEAEAKLNYAKIDVGRRQAMVKQAGLEQNQLDVAKQNLQVAEWDLVDLKNNLITAKLGARQDQINAAKQQVWAAKAALQGAEWNLNQKTIIAPITGLVFDRYYYLGEQVSAFQPVLSLLDPNNIKALFWVNEEELSTIKLGDQVRVNCDGCQPLSAKISFISPQAEYTPPVIYSESSRSKLRFRIEARFKVEDRFKLHPGQPIDIIIVR